MPHFHSFSGSGCGVEDGGFHQLPQKVRLLRYSYNICWFTKITVTCEEHFRTKGRMTGKFVSCGLFPRVKPNLMAMRQIREAMSLTLYQSKHDLFNSISERCQVCSEMLGIPGCSKVLSRRPRFCSGGCDFLHTWTCQSFKLPTLIHDPACAIQVLHETQTLSAKSAAGVLTPKIGGCASCLQATARGVP